MQHSLTKISEHIVLTGLKSTRDGEIIFTKQIATFECAECEREYNTIHRTPGTPNVCLRCSGHSGK